MKVIQARVVLAALRLCCALVAPLSAQGIYRQVHPLPKNLWTVDAAGGADFTDLPEAVQAARSGDVLLVAPGNYTAFELRGRGLTILGNGSSPFPLIRGRVTVRGIPAGEELILRSIAIQGLGQGALRLESNAGSVWIESCTLDQGTLDGASVVDCASVVFVRTNILRGSTYYSSSLSLPVRSSQRAAKSTPTKVSFWART